MRVQLLIVDDANDFDADRDEVAELMAWAREHLPTRCEELKQLHPANHYRVRDEAGYVGIDTTYDPSEDPADEENWHGFAYIWLPEGPDGEDGPVLETIADEAEVWKREALAVDYTSTCVAFDPAIHRVPEA